MTKISAFNQRVQQATIAAFSIALLLVAYHTSYASSPGATATPTPAPAVVLSGHTGGVTALAWSPDGSRLASAAGGFDSTDDTVRLWRADGMALATLTGDAAPVASLAWSPDGKTLATGGFDGKIGLWSADGALLKMIDAHAGIVFKLAWSPDGSVLASGSVAGPASNVVQWWQPDGSLLIIRSTDYSGGKFYNLGWSPDGKFLVAGATSYTEWRADGRPVFTYEGCASCTPAWGFAWSPDSSRWATGDESGNVTLYGIDGKQIASAQNNGNVDVLAWSPDGKTLAGGSVTLWNADGSLITTLTGMSSRASVLVWSPDGQLLAVSSGWDNASSNAIFLWGADFQRLEPLVGHTAPVASLAWSPDGHTLASGSLDQTIRLWQMTVLR